ncbi:MAG: hypothetical protein PSU93_09460 [Methylobacter sp.]|uniref:Uncharacterized protein n=1 Tax=Candidatus Methylobacter titanis TaxID=3053457 RepID=A0AA43Q430_9GAMM|nr:hypothetical protein [Candidatus Methylobacter titanis]
MSKAEANPHNDLMKSAPRLKRGEAADTVSRKEICALWGICASRLVDIILNHRHLNFPAPLNPKAREIRYETRAVQDWKARTAMDQIKWKQPNPHKKPKGLDTGMLLQFLAGGYDPKAAQAKYLRRRYQARTAKAAAWDIVTTEDSGFIKDTHPMRGLL